MNRLDKMNIISILSELNGINKLLVCVVSTPIMLSQKEDESRLDEVLKELKSVATHINMKLNEIHEDVEFLIEIFDKD